MFSVPVLPLGSSCARPARTTISNLGLVFCLDAASRQLLLTAGADDDLQRDVLLIGVPDIELHGSVIVALASRPMVQQPKLGFV